MKVGKKAYGTKGLIETHLASKSSPPTIDNSMDHVTRFVSRYSLIYGQTNVVKTLRNYKYKGLQWLQIIDHVTPYLKKSAFCRDGWSLCELLRRTES